MNSPFEGQTPAPVEEDRGACEEACGTKLEGHHDSGWTRRVRPALLEAACLDTAATGNWDCSPVAGYRRTIVAEREETTEDTVAMEKHTSRDTEEAGCTGKASESVQAQAEK
jgi:hypothetical protein